MFNILTSSDSRHYEDLARRNKKNWLAYRRPIVKKWKASKKNKGKRWSDTHLTAEQQEIKKNMLTFGVADPKQIYRNSSEYADTYRRMEQEFIEAHPDGLFEPNAKQKAELDKIRNNNIDTIYAKMQRLIAEHPEMRKRMQLSDLLGSKGLMQIRQENGDAHAQLWSIILGRFGTGTPKPIQDAVPYSGEVFEITDGLMSRAYVEGGARMFSFSDFDITKVFDIMQIVWDMAARKAKLQSYSKESSYVILFGKTGTKINISTLPKAVVSEDLQRRFKEAKGKDKDGNERKKLVQHEGMENAGLILDGNGRITDLSWSEEHSAKPDFCMKVFLDPERNANCGAITVGASVNHSIFAAAQDWIRMVIPFHLSGMPAAARARTDVNWYYDNTPYQNTRVKVGKNYTSINSKAAKDAKLVDYDFYENEDDPNWDMRTECRKYVQWCEERGYIPRFDWGINSDHYRAFCEREGYTPNQQIIDIMDNNMTDGVWNGYYKFITDFNAYKPVLDENGEAMHDENGHLIEESAPHRPVTNNISLSDAERVAVFGDLTGDATSFADESVLQNRTNSIKNADTHMQQVVREVDDYLEKVRQHKDGEISDKEFEDAEFAAEHEGGSEQFFKNNDAELLMDAMDKDRGVKESKRSEESSDNAHWERGTDNFDERVFDVGDVSKHPTTDFPKDMAYRETDINELKDILESGVLRKLPEGKTVEFKPDTSNDGGVPKIRIRKLRGNSHGGKGFSKGAPWSTLGGSLAYGGIQKVLIGVDGASLQWQEGHHGSYSDYKDFSEIEHGSPLFLPFNNNGDVEGIHAEDLKFWAFGKDGKLYEIEPKDGVKFSKREAWKNPVTMSNEEKAARGNHLMNATAIDVKSNQIVKTEDKSARKVAEEWWMDNVGDKPLHYNTEIGNVDIDIHSVKDSLAHRYSQAKLDAITSLEDGFNNAVYLGTFGELKERTNDKTKYNHYFAYPINYEGKRNFVFCRVMEDDNKNRLYVHEVFIADNIQNGGNVLQTVAREPRGNITSYKAILANVLDAANVANNSETVQTSSDENGVRESKRSLVGVHNITEEKLGKALKLGGLANPSVAVVDSDKGTHDRFGEISLILPSSMVDKQTGRNAGTFLGDAYTPRFPSISKDATLENISEEMRKQGLNDAEGSSGTFHSFVASVLKPVGSLDEIRERKGQLTNDANAFLDFEDLAPIFSNLTTLLRDRDGSDWNEGYERLKEIASKKNPRKYAKAHYGDVLNEGDLDNLEYMLNEIKRKPSKYFETKFERPVTLDEFASAVVPSNVSQKVRKGLEDARLELHEYDPKKKGDRERAFKEATEGEGVKFSKRTPSSSELALRDGLVDVLREAGVGVSMSEEEGQRVLDMVNGRAREKDAQITDHVRFFRSKDGEAYGFTVDGKIYLDPKKVNAETPIHEYAHLWSTALQQKDAKAWGDVVNLMKGTGIWDSVREAYPELKTDDEIADEVLATYSGQRGAERLRDEMRKVMQGEGRMLDKVDALSALERVRNAIARFWRKVAGMLGIRYTKAEDVADHVLGDLLEGRNPNVGVETDGKAREDQIFLGSINHIKESRRVSGRMANTGNTSRVAQDIYEEAVRGRGFEWDEAWHDSLASVKALQDALAKERGADIRDLENVYLHMVHLSSVGAAEMTEYRNKQVENLLSAMDAILKDKTLTMMDEDGNMQRIEEDDVEAYLNCKHAFERNEHIARKKAKAEADEEYADELKRLNAEWAKAAEEYNKNASQANKDKLDKANSDLDAKQKERDAYEDSQYKDHRLNDDYSGLCAG